jgi:TonB family protein
MPHTSFVRRLGGVPQLMWGLLVGVLAVAPRSASAQDASKEYALADLSTPVQLASPSDAAKRIQRAYPPNLLRAGIGGTVQVEFTVGADGKVEAGSVQVDAATIPALADAAKSIVPDIRFKPGTVNGTPVRARVVLPIVFKPK